MASVVTAPAEEKELSLVNKLELRIALATEDAKLEALLKTYLPPLLLKLKSPHFSVVQKVSFGDSTYISCV
jgi:proteasome component ECM29